MDCVLQRGMSLSPQKSMRADQIDEMLARLRDRQCVKEAPLDKVLSHPRKYRKDFGNARQLLSEVRCNKSELFLPVSR